MLSRISTFAMTSGARDQIAEALLPDQIDADVHLDIPTEHLEQADHESVYGDQEEEETNAFDPSGEPVVCAVCGKNDPDHEPDCQVMKKAVQDYFQVAYSQLHWSRDEALDFIDKCGGRWTVALERAKQKLSQA